MKLNEKELLAANHENLHGILKSYLNHGNPLEPVAGEFDDINNKLAQEVEKKDIIDKQLD
jgi:hypothetical protein